MSNATFIAILYSNDLISRELKNQLNLSHRTSAEKATLFLDSVIEPSVTVSGNCFDELLNVMEDNDHQGVKELAKLIKTSLRKKFRKSKLIRPSLRKKFRKCKQRRSKVRSRRPVRRLGKRSRRTNNDNG